MMEELQRKNQEKNRGPDSVSHPFVGTNGIVMKATTVDAIKKYDILNDEGTMLDTSIYQSI